MSFEANLVNFIDTYPFLFLLVIILVPAIFIIAVIMLKHRKEKISPVTIINQAQPEQAVSQDDEKLEVTGRLDQEIARRMFGIGRKIKNAVIGISIAIPFAILSYLISENLGITVASLFIFILFGWFWAKKWVKPEGVQIILDGDIEKDNPSAGVQHIDYIIPYEQWKYIIFTDQGGAYPIKTIDGMAYRAKTIEFWDPERRIVKSVELAWMHNPHSNFEQEHELNHKLEAWLKTVLKLLNSYRHLNEIASIVEAKRLTDERERVRYNAKSSPSRVSTDIDQIMSNIKDYEAELKKIQRTGKETKEKVDIDKGSEDVGDAGAGEG